MKREATTPTSLGKREVMTPTKNTREFTTPTILDKREAMTPTTPCKREAMTPMTLDKRDATMDPEDFLLQNLIHLKHFLLAEVMPKPENFLLPDVKPKTEDFLSDVKPKTEDSLSDVKPKTEDFLLPDVKPKTEDLDSKSSIDLVPSSKQKKRKTESNTKSEPSQASKKAKIEDWPGLDDHLDSDLDIIFCGINPGKTSSQIGHYFANPTNQFWSCLFQSGFTPRLLAPKEDYTLPQDFSMGLTTLVCGPTIEKGKLTRAVQVAGVPALMEKIAKYRPRVTCFVGLGIADIVKSVLISENPKSKTVIGLQPYKMVYPNENPCQTLFYAISSTSGRVVQYQKSDKVRQFNDLRVLVEKVKTGDVDTEDLISVDIALPDDEGN